jgi:fibronectin-binding autotransporter adhesin
MKKYPLIAACLTTLSLTNVTLAQTLFWDGGTANITTNGDGASGGGSGTWNETIQNWDQGSGLPHVGWTDGDSATFAGTAGVVTLGSAVTADTLTFTTKGYGFTDGGNSANTISVNTITNLTGGTIATVTIFTNNIVNSTTLNIWSSNSDVRFDAADNGLTGTLAVNQGTVEIGDGVSMNGGFGGGWNGVIGSTGTLIVRNTVNNSVVGNTFSGPGILEVANKSGVATILTGNNTYTGSTVIASGSLIALSMDDVNPNPVGTGPLQVGNNASAGTFNYQGASAFTTTRPLVLGGNGPSILNGASGEAITFAGPFEYGPNITGTSKTLELIGASFTDQGFDTVACNLTNFGSVPLIVNKQTGTWVLTGSNSFTGGVVFSGGSSGALYITNDMALGVSNGGIFFTNGGGTVSSYTANVTIGPLRTVTIITNAGGFSVADTNVLTVSAFITGSGYAVKNPASYLLGVVRFNNDSNNYTGGFNMAYGNTEFTSVGDAGVPSSLGAGAAITNANSTSFGILRYVGTQNSATHRPLVWTASSGPLGLDVTNTGTIAYLATTPLTVAAGSKTLEFLGSNPGTNTLAQVINDDGGVTTVTKSGASRWILTAANTYSGTTAVSGGTLQVNGSLPAGKITVSGTGTLDGNGIIAGPIAVTGGTLAAGTPADSFVSTLTINNTVSNSGTIFIKLNKATASSDMLSGITTISLGGTLSLTNLGGTLTTNDSFHIFSASSYQGAFATITPATPGPGLAWNTNNLAINGTLGISAGVPVQTATFSSITYSGGTLTLQGTNGPASSPFVVLTTTNVALPAYEWTPLLTNAFDSGGNFNVSTNISGTTQQFFILSQ